ncbi:MAG: hypothetical protein QY325_03420 [Flavobacteriales bacterium]|jgi:hypothetical protein|nr:MAG: hypothetical protein QY325_03420 [Flavobacteriales bacterium]
MWPVQTLTLLLCLTDEEQLFAQSLPREKEMPAVEADVPEQVPLERSVELCIEPAA